MIHLTSSFRAPVVPGLAALALALAACGDHPALLHEPEIPALHSLSSITLLNCPVAESRSASATIGSAGGTLELDGHSIRVPEGAVSAPTEFTLAVPAGQHLKVEFTADGRHGFSFARSAFVGVSYAHCGLTLFSVSAWYLDPVTGEPIQRMTSMHQFSAKRVTFGTNHLSLFALAD
jgi:hypothetical protein